MESVAGRARVGKSTIHRLWPDKLALIEAAFRTLHEELGPDLDLGHGTARARVERIMGHVARSWPARACRGPFPPWWTPPSATPASARSTTAFSAPRASR